jgi:hypothetical protein
MKKEILSILLIVFCMAIINAQSSNPKTEYHNLKLESVLQDIQIKYNIKFDFDKKIVNTSKRINLKPKNRSLQEILSEIESITNLTFTQLDGFHFYISKLEVVLLQKNKSNKFLSKSINKNKDGSYAFSLDKLNILPGLIEPDVFESLQKLPSVNSINETASELNVQGGRTDQNNILFDDISIYLSGHLYGMVSAINPYLVKNMTFYNKGTNARYGERISSVIDMNTTSEIPKKTNLEIGLNAINYDLLLQTPVIPKKIGLQLAYRHSYAKLFETPTFKNYEDKTFQNTKITDENFNFNDYSAQLNYQLNTKNKIHLSFIHIDNDLENTRSNETNSFSDVLDMENKGYSVKWDKKWSKKITQETSVSYSKYTLFYNLNTFSIASNDLKSNLKKENFIIDKKINTDFNIHFKKSGQLNFGYQYKNQNVAFNITSKKGITYVLGNDNNTINTHSFYVGFTTKKTLNYFVYLGNRINYYDKYKVTKFEPRFVVNKNLNRYIKIQLTGEIKNQIIHKINETLLNNYTADNTLWRLSDNINIPIINAKHLSTDLIFEKNNWTIDASLFYKKITGLSSIALGYLNSNDTSIHLGEGQVKGANIFILKKFNKLSTWISYSYNEVKNRYKGILNNNYFTANTQIKNAFSVSFLYKYKKFSVAGNWIYRTGKPKTDLDYDADGHPYFDSLNTETLPDFHRLDLSSTYKFKFSKKIKGKIGVSVRNVYNNKNLIATNFTGNNTLNDNIYTSNFYSIGMTPNFMFRLFF